MYFCTNFINIQENLQDTIVPLSPKKFQPPITYYSKSFIEKLHSYQYPKEMDLKAPHLFLILCFKIQ